MLCAVAAVGWLFSRPTSAEPQTIKSDWEQEVVQQGMLVAGKLPAPLVIVEFVDFECPFCGTFAEQVDTLKTEFPEVAVVMHHFPVPQHKYAAPAAIVSECADRQGRGGEIYTALFDAQEEFGMKPWHDYAVVAGVPDLDTFDQCILLPQDSFPRIRYGQGLGEKNMVRGTPEVWANKKWWGGYTSMETLRQRIREELK